MIRIGRVFLSFSSLFFSFSSLLFFFSSPPSLHVVSCLRLQAKKVLAISESEGRNAHTIEYDERNPFTICCGSLTPIYKGSPIIRSPYCNAGYKPEFKGTLCTIDGMSQVGTETVGLVCTPATSGRR